MGRGNGRIIDHWGPHGGIWGWVWVWAWQDFRVPPQATSLQVGGGGSHEPQFYPLAPPISPYPPIPALSPWCHTQCHLYPPTPKKWRQSQGHKCSSFIHQKPPQGQEWAPPTLGTPIVPRTPPKMECVGRRDTTPKTQGNGGHPQNGGGGGGKVGGVHGVGGDPLSRMGEGDWVLDPPPTCGCRVRGL